jgi:hypothetical protein
MKNHWGGEMRHFTWAVTWVVVGVSVTLGIASVLGDMAMARRNLSVPPVVEPATPAPVLTPRPPSEPGQRLVVAWRRHRAGD